MTVCIFFFSLVFVFIMPISTVPNCKIIVLAVPTMIARLKKASTLLSTVSEEIRKLIIALSGIWYIFIYCQGSTYANGGCFASVANKNNSFFN